jgi:hypothetical protein
MRYLKILTIALAVILLPALTWASLDGSARISLLEGDVLVRSEDTSEWFPASVNTPLLEGDSIWCPADSRAEIQLQNGTLIRLDQQTSLDVLVLADDSLQFYLGMGNAYFNTGDLRGAGFQVDLIDASVMVYDKGRFRIDLSGEGDADVSVIKGSAYVESNGQKIRVRAGEMLSVAEGNPEIFPLNPPGEWERWNVARDRNYFAVSSTTGYLPAELGIYERDLNANGEWVYDTAYGNVWRPTVITASDWSPYRVGRWVWRGGDYVWISHENWGWAPYHYGRWINLASRGWCWVPPVRGEVYWSPGYVGWVTTASYVGWFPLAPGEIYYGRGYYGRNSVNITNVNVRDLTVNRVVYRNLNGNRAVTVVNRNSFASGTMTYVKPRENIFVQAKIQLGRPDIKPAKQAMMPVVRTVSPAKLPPPGIRNVPLQDLRRHHPRREGNPSRFTEKNGFSLQNGKQQQTVNPRNPDVRQPVAGSVPAIDYHRSLAEKPAARPEIINYPNGRPQTIDRQKSNVVDPGKRYRELQPTDRTRTVAPVTQKAVESPVLRNSGNDHNDLPQRQKAQNPGPVIPVNPQVPASAGSATTWPARNIDRPAAPQKAGDQRTNTQQGIGRHGGNPVKVQPEVTPKVREKSATPAIDADNRNVWKEKGAEKSAAEVRPEGKRPERGLEKPLRLQRP